MLDDLQFAYTHFPWIFAAFVTVIGACVGSFLNVCIYRIPREMSIIHPRSHDLNTGEEIAWYDNIPILSWFILGGKSRQHRSPISFRYPAVEALTAGLFLACWLVWADVSMGKALAGMVFVSLLIPATFIDLDHMIIPDRFSIGGVVAGFGLSLAFPGLHGVEVGGMTAHFQSGLHSLVGILVGTALIYWVGTFAEIVLRKPAMGEGDWKLLGAVGAFCGWEGAVFGLFGGSFIGVLVILPLMMLFRKKGEEKTEAEQDEDEAEGSIGFGVEIPFGPMLALGGVLYFLFLQGPVDAYFENLKILFIEPDWDWVP